MSASTAESDEDASSDCTFVLRRWSDDWKIEPEYVALPLSKTENTVVEALLTTAKALVEADDPHFKAAIGGRGADTNVSVCSQIHHRVSDVAAVRCVEVQVSDGRIVRMTLKDCSTPAAKLLVAEVNP